MLQLFSLVTSRSSKQRTFCYQWQIINKNSIYFKSIRNICSSNLKVRVPSPNKKHSCKIVRSKLTSPKSHKRTCKFQYLPLQETIIILKIIKSRMKAKRIMNSHVHPLFKWTCIMEAFLQKTKTRVASN